MRPHYVRWRGPPRRRQLRTSRARQLPPMPEPAAASAVALARRPQLLLNLAPSEPVPTARGAERRLQHALPHPRADGAGGDAQPTRDLAAGDQRFVARFGHGSDGRSTFEVIKAVNTNDANEAFNAIDAHLRFAYVQPADRPVPARPSLRVLWHGLHRIGRVRGDRARRCVLPHAVPRVRVVRASAPDHA